MSHLRAGELEIADVKERVPISQGPGGVWRVLLCWS